MIMNLILNRLRFHLRPFSRLMSNKVLGIETSCDETGISIVDSEGHILSDVCESQLQIHLANGGIIPPLAKDLHRLCIDNSVKQCLELANMSPQELTAIAVTLKPGLPLSLLIGKNYAKALALKYRKPIIPIHHMEAHALMALLEYKSLDFPFVTLLISGGHCLIAIAENVTQFKLLGKSIDDAPGDLLDKISRKLKLKNLGHPFDQISGGEAVEVCARNGNPFAFFTDCNSYPLYTSAMQSCDFSFSGFHSPVDRIIHDLEKESNLGPDQVLTQSPDICASIQYAITFMLIKRIQRAFNYINEQNLFNQKPIKLVISGGCACNHFITNSITNFCKSENIETFIPSKRLCTDNGIMIAWNGILKLLNEHNFPELIVRDEERIRNIDITAKSDFGEDIRSHLISTKIKCEQINVKQFIKQDLDCISSQA